MFKVLRARNIVRSSIVLALAAVAAGCSGAGTSPGAIPQTGSQAAATQPLARGAGPVEQQIALGNYVQACATPVSGNIHCLALGLKNPQLAPRLGNDLISGFTPPELQAAYNITNAAKKNSGGLVALIEYGGYPTLEADLKVYRKQFGLPKCTTKDKCLQIVNQSGKTKPLPATNAGWDAEQALDLDMVSANCPNCTILVVEASSNLFAAENTAATFNPVAMSNSWGEGEYNGEVSDEQTYFNHPGIAITASSGDGGYGVIFPSAASTVTAVGGTSLKVAQGSRGYTETVWSDSGSGCSAYVPVPTWQAAIEQQLGGCSNRIVSDVAYVANPGTGVAVYETTKGDGEAPGWQVWGGTSVGSPAIAAIYALSGNTAGVPAALAYSNASDLYDVTSGSDGSCSPAYLCTGEVGYDGPTGNGTPNGVGAF